MADPSGWKIVVKNLWEIGMWMGILWKGTLLMNKRGPESAHFSHPPDWPRQSAGASREVWTLAQGSPFDPSHTHLWPTATLVYLGTASRAYPPDAPPHNRGYRCRSTGPGWWGAHRTGGWPPGNHLPQTLGKFGDHFSREVTPNRLT